MENNDVLTQRTGHLGHLILNRPQAMNALNAAMITLLANALDEWETDDAVATVLITGAGGRGLCAGGDVVSIYHDALSGGQGTEAFWRAEYQLNARIKRYSKPIVVLMDGVVLGGGVGISAHASHRIVTERSRVGMPETAIGFVPDVGGTFLLARAPGQLGTHAALTGTMLSGADAITMGLASHFVDSAALPALVAELSERHAGAVVARWGQAAPESELVTQRWWIDEAYAPDDAETILERLARVGDPAADAAAKTIAGRSPTAVAVTLAALRRARVLPSLEDGLNQDFRVSLRALNWPDFTEGIRAQLVDKDRNPVWSPATLAEIAPEAVAGAFADLSERELALIAP